MCLHQKQKEFNQHMEEIDENYEDVFRDPTMGGRGENASGRHFWSKEGIANGFSRMSLKLHLGFRFG